MKGFPDGSAQQAEKNSKSSSKKGFKRKNFLRHTF